MDVIEKITGLSAGKICFSNFEVETPELRAVVETAEIIWEDMKSAWYFVELYMDNSTLWHSPDGEQMAIVSPDGTIQIQQRD